MAGGAKQPLRVVVDASFMLAILLPDESVPEVFQDIFEHYLHGRAELYAPSLLFYEVINGLRTAVLRRRLSQETAFKLLTDYLVFQVNYKDGEAMGILQLAFEHHLSVYDATYVSLARHAGFPLYTLDRKLQQLVG